MKPIIIYDDRLLAEWAGGMMLFPFIILRTKYKNIAGNAMTTKKKALLNHETIHFEQAKETFVILFYLIWLTEFVFKSLYYKSFNLGYKNISFEREAYAHDDNLNYLDNRKRFTWISYILQN